VVADATTAAGRGPQSAGRIPRVADQPQEPAVLVENLHKQFRIPHERVHTIKERALHPFRRNTYETLHALDDVSFEVGAGEFFGIAGRNGSGKSTLLKCLAGIYAADRGAIYVDGQLSTFIELGVGFNPDLPARDNVMLNATMLGLSPREASRRFDEVIAFAELEDFVDLKLKNYSSGMEVRLAFSVMIQVDAEILVIDEVLAVGDAAFQQKCFDEFARIRQRGRTVLLVTHDMSAVQRFCDRALLLDRGKVVEIGDPERIGTHYLELNFGHDRRDGADGDAGERFGDGRAEIVEGWFEDATGRRADTVPTGEPCSFAARVRFHETVDDPLFGVNLQNAQRDTLLAASNLWSDPEPGRFAAGEEVVFRIRFENFLAADRYFATPAVARSGGGGLAWLDRREWLASVVVTGVRRTDALVDLPYEVDLER
jgi:ABC-type polysaccharide/polyol phosphate transport system ATPase subunit